SIFHGDRLARAVLDAHIRIPGALGLGGIQGAQGEVLHRRSVRGWLLPSARYSIALPALGPLRGVQGSDWYNGPRSFAEAEHAALRIRVSDLRESLRASAALGRRRHGGMSRLRERQCPAGSLQLRRFQFRRRRAEDDG